jgi:hypothetical protein
MVEPNVLTMVDRIASLRERVKDLEKEILATLQQDKEGKSLHFELATRWLEEAKEELRVDEEIRRQREEEEFKGKQRRDEELFQEDLRIKRINLEEDLKDKRRKLEGIWLFV